MSKKIATHNGDFHADEVFAVATLCVVLGEGNIEIIRTREQKKIDCADFVVDVGGKYSSEENLFDHHQLSGAGERENGIPYASFGLVWKKYGEEVAGSKKVSELVDFSLVQSVDAEDSGIDLYKPNYNNVGLFSLKYIIDMFLPLEDDETKIDSSFMSAVDFARFVIESEILNKKREADAIKTIEEVYEKSEDKRIIIFDTKAQWGSLAVNYPDVLFVVYPDKKDEWRAEVVRKGKNTFEARKNLPKAWAGKREGEFAEMTGVKDAVFCHRALFTCGAISKEGAIKLAKLAVDN